MDNKLIPVKLQEKLPAYRVDPAEAQALLVEYGAPFTEAGEILAIYETIKVKDEGDKASMKLARDYRLKVRQVRIGVENKRKQLKEDINKRANAIDGVARFVKEVLAPAEEYLQSQEDYAKLLAAKRAADRLAKRIETLSPLTNNTSVYDLESLDDDDFNALVERLTRERDERIAAEAKAKAGAEARAEAERVERERIRAENEELRKQAEAERLKRVELERVERERVEAEQAVLRADRERQRKELLAPDRDKLLNFSRALEIVRAEKLPEVASDEAKVIVDRISTDLVAMQNMITQQAAQL